jgi:hypothetical protein
MSTSAAGPPFQCESRCSIQTLLIRFPDLADRRVLSFVTATALAVLSFVASGDATAALGVIHGGR